MTQKLNAMAGVLWQNIFVNLNDFFQGIINIHKNLAKPDKDKITEFFTLGANLLEFQKKIIEVQIDKLKQLASLVHNSPKYVHVNQLYIKEIEQKNLKGAIYTKIEDEVKESSTPTEGTPEGEAPTEPVEGAQEGGEQTQTAETKEIQEEMARKLVDELNKKGQEERKLKVSAGIILESILLIPLFWI